MKPGIKTTEFWAALLTIAGTSAASLQGVLDPKWAAILSTVASVSYTIARALTKTKTTQIVEEMTGK